MGNCLITLPSTKEDTVEEEDEKVSVLLDTVVKGSPQSPRTPGTRNYPISFYPKTSDRLKKNSHSTFVTREYRKKGM